MSKGKTARQRHQMGNFIVPSPHEIEEAMSPAGGWTALTLAGWGIKWPPHKGWRKALIRQWKQQHATHGDTP